MELEESYDVNIRGFRISTAMKSWSMMDLAVMCTLQALNSQRIRQVSWMLVSTQANLNTSQRM